MSDHTPTSAEPGARADATPPRAQADPLDPWLTEWLALREFARHYAIATLDRIEDGVRAARRRSITLILTTLCLASLLVYLVVLTIQGIDGAVMSLCGTPWLAHFLTGAGGLAGVIIALCLARRREDRRIERRRAGVYARQKARQESLVGRTVDTPVEIRTRESAPRSGESA